MQAFPTTLAFQPAQAVPWPSKKRTLGDESQNVEQEPEHQRRQPPEVRDNAEVNGKKQRIASFFEDTDYSAELKASRDAILGTDTAMDQEAEEDFDFDEDEASYVPRSTYEPSFTSQQHQAQPHSLHSPASMSSLTSGSGRSAWESSMPGTPLDSPAVGQFQLAQGSTNMVFSQQQQYQHVQQPDADMMLGVNNTPRAAPPAFVNTPPHPKPSLGMMEDDFPVKADRDTAAADASFSSTVEAEPYLSWFYGKNQRP